MMRIFLISTVAVSFGLIATHAIACERCDEDLMLMDRHLNCLKGGGMNKLMELSAFMDPVNFNLSQECDDCGFTIPSSPSGNWEGKSSTSNPICSGEALPTGYKLDVTLSETQLLCLIKHLPAASMSGEETVTISLSDCQSN